MTLLAHETARRSSAKPWLEDLERLARDRSWVKGAVNYDEDLHFSTYYLRASCSPRTRRLYPGYSCFVASYEGFNETYWLLESECRATAQALVERALARPRWLPGVLREIRKRSDALAGIFRPDTTPRDLERLSQAKLVALYRRHHSRTEALYLPARLPEALDRGVSYFTGYLQSHLRAKGLDERACAEAFATLSQPIVPSVLSQEIAEFDEIVRYARSRPGLLPTAVGNRARLLLEPELRRRIEDHREKWQFLTYHGYGRRELATLDHYLGRLVDQDGRLAERGELEARSERARRERRQLLDRLELDPAHAALFELYPEIGAVKLYRRYAQLRNFYFLDMLLAEIARRLAVSEWTVRSMLPEEILASLAAGGLVAPAIRERTEACVFVCVEGKERVLSGADAARVRDLLRECTRPPSTGNVLRGVVACRGMAKGRCKVVVRADDCKDGVSRETILVSESTDPDLLPLLRTAGAVLTEQGGVTSHAAIVCRELGVPTIIGVDGLLDRVRDGDWLEVDAERGTVTIARQGEVRGTTPAARADEIGPKAWNLGFVRSHGFRVPDYVVLRWDEVQSASAQGGTRSLRKHADQVLAELPSNGNARLAIRSSAVTEDRADGSAAGAFHTILSVEPRKLATSLRDFVRRNQAGRNGSAYRGSIIVQRMVRSDVAGVCITRDRRTGRGDSVTIELAAGGNAGITGGTVRPDRLVVDRRTGDILEDERRSTALARKPLDVLGLVQEFLKLESLFGAPLDIEWALSGSDLYILQARPIVTRREE